MIRFDEGNARFNFRSVAVVVHEGHVLLHKSVTDDFWALPGGRVEFFENSDATVKRELLEELGLESKIIRPLWYVENFFEHSEKQYHEVSNYFLVELLEPYSIEKGVEVRGLEQDCHLIFKWFTFEELHSISFKPEILFSKMQNLPESVEFIKINELAA